MPRPLALLLGAVLVVCFTWALLVPVAQAPDEDAHFGYLQTVAEDFRLPDADPGRTYSSEQSLLADRSNSAQTAGQPLARPEWSPLIEHAWQRQEDRLGAASRDNGGHNSPSSGANSARSNPPAYYLLSALPYRAATSSSILDRWYLARLWSALFVLVTVIATWLLIGELVPGRQSLQLGGAALVGLQPMVTFVSSTVSPDGLLFATWALVLWLGVRLLRRGWSLAGGLALCGITALAILTKATSYALLPGVAFVFAVTLWRTRREISRILLPLATAGLLLVVPVLAWRLIARSLGREGLNAVAGGTSLSGSGPTVVHVDALNYLWQYYLPKLPFQDGIAEIERLPAFDVWIKTGWAAFGWLEVRFPEPLYIVLALVTVGLMVGGAIALVRGRRPGDLAVAGFLVITVVSLLAGLHWADYRAIVYAGAPLNQGRYLLPVLPVLGVCAAATLSLLRGRSRSLALGALVGGLVVLQFFSLALVGARFYA